MVEKMIVGLFIGFLLFYICLMAGSIIMQIVTLKHKIDEIL